MSAIGELKHSAKQFLWKWLTRRLHLNWKLKSGIPVIIRSYSDWCTYNEIFVNGEYIQPIRDVLSIAKERICVLDLGANVGYFTLMLADMFLQAHGSGGLAIRLVEASPPVAKELKRRLELLGERLDIGITCGLVGGRSGSGLLNFAKEDNQHFVGEATQLEFGRRAHASQLIPYVDLDVLAAESRMPIIDLIKCDIEGSEFAFVECYPDLLRKTLRVVIEVHTDFGDEKQVTAGLISMGFKLHTAIRESAALSVLYFSRV